jgi:GNAT superfamily N-acetyltransferase
VKFVDTNADGALGPELARELELSEARAYESLAQAPTELERAQLGLSALRLGSALAVKARGIPKALNLNRVIGLGVDEPITGVLLDQVVEHFADVESAYAMDLCPLALSADVKLLLRSRQLRALVNKAAMFIHRLDDLPSVESSLRIERVDGRYAEQLADICCDIFGMAPQTRLILRAAHRHPGWYQWMGFDGDEPAGVALSYVGDSVAWSGWAATLPAFRGRRFHAAYLAKAVQHAAQLGCRTFTAETATGTETQRDPAYRNLLSLGFELVYERATYMGRPRAKLQAAA